MDKTLELGRFVDQPFRLLPGERVTVWAGYPEIRDQLLHIIEDPRSDRVGMYEFAILHGPLGAGKSHALRYMKHLITEEQAADFSSIVVYLDRLRVSARPDFLAIYQGIMRLLRPDLVRVASIVEEIAEEQVELSWNKQSEDLRRRMRKDDFRKSELPAIYSSLAPMFPALPRLLAAASGGDDKALSVLMGAKPKGVNPSRYEMDAFIDTEYEALRCLAAFVNLCTSEREGIARLPIHKCFYLFIDEVEILRELPTTIVLSINTGLRDLVNACPENFCLLLGASAEAEVLEAYFEEWVMTRLSRNPIEFPVLEPDQAVSFLKEVMSKFRQPDAMVPESFPFEEDALKDITQSTTERTPRSLFRSCQTVLRKAVLSGRLEQHGTITIADVGEFLE